MQSSEEQALVSAIAAHRAGDGAAAEAGYRRVLAINASNPEANHNIGVLLAQAGNTGDALPFFRTAWQANNSRGQFWISYARALLAEGMAAEAQQLLRKGRQHGLSGGAVDALLEQAARSSTSNGPADLLARGDTALAEGRLAEALDAWREALGVSPDMAGAHLRLGSVLSESGDVAGGFAHYMRHAAIIHEKLAPRPPDAPEHRVKHDREQQAFLAALNPRVAAERFHVADGARLATTAVNPTNATADLFAAWHRTRPQMVVIDGFLNPQALHKLREYCAQSTIWHRNYDAGYIGATPADGFACPLLAQIAEDIMAIYRPILDGHAFRYLGAFKYDSSLSTGTNTHADNAAINVNFYIAPDDANLDPDSGGMDVWDVSVPPGEDLDRYNRDEAAMQQFLNDTGAAMTRIPHRANRAVIFRSDLVHKTSPCRFREGYRNKRINVSFLFGLRGG